MRFTIMRSLEAIASVSLLSHSVIAAQNSTLPVVDLGYELYRAADFNQTGGYYNFSNIRYAAPPLGDLRFRAPRPPETNRSVTHDGLDGRVCPQANPAWALIAAEFIPQYLATGTVPNITTTTSSNSSTSSARDPRENEDCLFLDVIVPENIFERRGQNYSVPVLVWVHGGGYIAGEKITAQNPIGLLTRGQGNYSDGAIFVAMNYRLGAFGWLAGPTFQEDGDSNAGLRDQRLAFEWVQDNIHLFGGDKNRVTVFGESAGGGSIIHQITAYGGQVSAPFQQAIPQSPAWNPIPSLYDQEQTFQGFLSTSNVSSLAEARNLSSEALIAANVLQVAASLYSLETYGPAVDGDFVPADPKTLLNHGQFEQSLNIMVGHNTQEGLQYAPPITNDSAYRSYVETSLASARSSIIEYIVNTLYPPVFDGSIGYTDNVGRAALTLSEYGFNCNAFALDRAFNNQTYAYLFGVPPGLHGQDVAYTYYNPGDVHDTTGFLSSLTINATVAHVLQDYIISFAQTGRPTSSVAGAPVFQTYGENSTVVNLTESGLSYAVDPGANERCEWWLLGLYS